MRGEVPFCEPGLSEMVIRGVQSGLHSLTTDTRTAVQSSDFLFIYVGTPSRNDDSPDLQYISPDLQYIMSVAEGIAQHINGREVIINKSNVPVGSADSMAERIAEGMAQHGHDHDFEVCSNPEFLKEASAVADAKSQDRVIVGIRSSNTIEGFRRMYVDFNRKRDKLMFMHPPKVPS